MPQQLDIVGVPPKPVADFLLAQQKRFIFLTTMHLNTLSVFIKSLDDLNFDESECDKVPIKDVRPYDQAIKKQQSDPSRADVEMKDAPATNNAMTVNAMTVEGPRLKPHQY